MMAKTERKEKKKQKRPTAQKRLIQNEVRQLQNQMLKSRLRTALTRFEKACASADKEGVTNSFSLVHSLADKANKKGVFPANKVNRIKSKVSKKLLTLA